MSLLRHRGCERRRLPAALAASSALWFGCARSPAPLPPPVPLERELVQSTLQRLEAEANAIRRYQGLLRIRGRGPEGSFDARLVVIFERPSSLRVELLGAFGSTRWSAVSDEEGITVYFPGPGHYVREADVEEVVRTLLGVPLAASEVMALLSGVGLPIEAPEGAEGFRRGDVLVLSVGEERGIQLGEDGQVAEARAPGYQLSYPTDWKRRGRQIPDRARIESETVRATLAMEDVDVNVALASEAFELEVPADAVRLRPAEVEGEAVFVITKEP